MKIKTIVYAQTLNGTVGDEIVTDKLNELLEEFEITSENLIDIKINIHPIFNTVVSEDTFLTDLNKYDELESNADYTSTRFVTTIIYKTEE